MAPKNFWNPIFGHILRDSQKMFGNLANSWILGLSRGLKVDILTKTPTHHFCSALGPQKGPKIKNLAKFPNSIWKTHEMQQLGQKWGSKSNLEPNEKGLPNFALEKIENPKIYWILGTCQLRDNTEPLHGKLFRFRKQFLKVQKLIFSESFATSFSTKTPPPPIP